ncbi:hypothetical protein VTK73DRAFT_3109 [Phialemonium thermophilum]|uniref:Uncharacterized protein n=1 Tax=Phialemonium thermophilum TaxID=223376 RepID=A0ABR3VKR7_9PEZI
MTTGPAVAMCTSSTLVRLFPWRLAGSLAARKLEVRPSRTSMALRMLAAGMVTAQQAWLRRSGMAMALDHGHRTGAALLCAIVDAGSWYLGSSAPLVPHAHGDTTPSNLAVYAHQPRYGSAIIPVSTFQSRSNKGRMLRSPDRSRTEESESLLTSSPVKSGNLTRDNGTTAGAVKVPKTGPSPKW